MILDGDNFGIYTFSFHSFLQICTRAFSHCDVRSRNMMFAGWKFMHDSLSGLMLKSSRTEFPDLLKGD